MAAISHRRRLVVICRCCFHTLLCLMPILCKRPFDLRTPTNRAEQESTTGTRHTRIYVSPQHTIVGMQTLSCERQTKATLLSDTCSVSSSHVSTSASPPSRKITAWHQSSSPTRTLECSAPRPQLHPPKLSLGRGREKHDHTDQKPTVYGYVLPAAATPPPSAAAAPVEAISAFG